MSSNIGWFGAIKQKIFGTTDEYKRRLETLEKQGSSVARIAHFVAFVMVILFSAGSLIALAGTTLTTVVNEWREGTVNIPAAISLGVAFLLVLCMDTGMIYAGLTLRLMGTRRAPWSDRWIHTVILVGVGLAEAATYFYMSVLYEHPTTQAAWFLIGMRSLAAPVLAIYLTLARAVPITAKDILYQAEVASGLNLLHTIGDLTSNSRHPLGVQWALFDAAAVMDTPDRERMGRMLSVAETVDGPQVLRITDADDPNGDGPKGGGYSHGRVQVISGPLADPGLAKVEHLLLENPERSIDDIAQTLGIERDHAKKLVGKVMRAHLAAQSQRYLLESGSGAVA